MDIENFSVYDKKDFRASFLARRSRGESMNNAIYNKCLGDRRGDWLVNNYFDEGDVKSLESMKL